MQIFSLQIYDLHNKARLSFCFLTNLRFVRRFVSKYKPLFCNFLTNLRFVAAKVTKQSFLLSTNLLIFGMRTKLGFVRRGSAFLQIFLESSYKSSYFCYAKKFVRKKGSAFLLSDKSLICKQRKLQNKVLYLLTNLL